MTQKNFRLAFEGSPFIPQIDTPSIMSIIKHDISKGFPPAAAIALALQSIMEILVEEIKFDQELMESYSLNKHHLMMLTLGYRYPLDTILASVICSKLLPEECDSVYEELVSPSHFFNILRIQDQISQSLRATINLFNIDTSTALIFQFLKDYPVFTQDEFLNGLEIAAILFFGLATKYAEETGNDGWLRNPYDPTDLG